MIKRFKSNDKKFYRVNERIFASSLRVLDSEGKQIGVLSKFEALDLARKQMLDLVEIAPKATPAVAKIIDYKKFLYQEEKKRREERKSAKTSDTKEVRLGPFMSANDLSVMVKRARDFLSAGNKVRLVVFFSGRQITHPQFGHQILDKALEMLSDISKVDRERRLEGKKLIILVSPQTKKQNEKVENQKISQQKI